MHFRFKTLHITIVPVSFTVPSRCLLNRRFTPENRYLFLFVVYVAKITIHSRDIFKELLEISGIKFTKAANTARILEWL